MKIINKNRNNQKICSARHNKHTHPGIGTWRKSD